MKLKRCAYGHYYDPSKYSSCPHCGGVQDEPDAGVTMAMYEEPAAPVYGQAQPAFEAQMPDDEERTMALYGEEVSVAEPPVGYLVCIYGAARRQDFRLHTQRNTIGRSSQMDVCIKGDLGISRESNAVLSYNPRNREFHLIVGQGKSIVYVNGEEVLQPRRLLGNERIEIGDTVLVFFPVCGPDFDWEDTTV